jgi:hypothetical protein
MLNTMKAVQISTPGGDFVVTERAIPEPGPGAVRLKVAACGVADPMTVSPAQLIGQGLRSKAGLRDLPRTPKTH